MIKTLVWPVAMYACEIWTMRNEKNETGSPENVDMERKWSDQKTNEQVLMDVEGERSFLKAVVKRKQHWIDHVVRGEGQMKPVTKGRMVGEEPIARLRIEMINDTKVMTSMVQ
jgi:hypothetical protein